jgi:hypothetical protein
VGIISEGDTRKYDQRNAGPRMNRGMAKLHAARSAVFGRERVRRGARRYRRVAKAPARGRRGGTVLPW